MAKKKRSIPQQIFLWVFQIVIVVLFAFVLVYFFGQTRACIGQSMSTTIEGGDDLFTPSLPFDQIAYVPDSEATTIAALKDDYNALLAALRSCGLMVSSK